MNSSIRSFALYRLPDSQEPVLIRQTQGEPLVMDSLSGLQAERGFLFAPFNPGPDHPVLLIKPDEIIRGDAAVEELSEELETWWHPKANDAVSDEEEDNARYRDVFKKFMRALQDKNFEKLVLSRKSTCPTPEGFSPVRAFEKACDKYPHMMVSLCYTERSGLWLGSTPEIIVEGKGKLWHTVALAGTMPAGEKNLHWSVKNRKEQMIVSDYIREKLKRFSSDIKVEGPYTSEAGHLVHLKTDIYFNLDESRGIGELLDSLHPTPAVCGMPEEKAMSFILDNEGYDRSWYSGITGILDPEDRTRLFVNLRCMQINEKEMHLYAGGGLLPSSDIDSEWEETQIKMNTMRNIC